MSVMKFVNLALRFLLELAAVAALTYWGFKTGGGTLTKFLLGIGVPALFIGIWGIFVSPRATVSLPGPAKFVLGLILLELAAFALAAAGQPILAMAFGAVVLINAALIAIWRQQETQDETVSYR